MKQNPTIAIIGLGYVGLPLAAAFAEKYKVIGFDINSDSWIFYNGAREANHSLYDFRLCLEAACGVFWLLWARLETLSKENAFLHEMQPSHRVQTA